MTGVLASVGFVYIVLATMLLWKLLGENARLCADYRRLVEDLLEASRSKAEATNALIELIERRQAVSDDEFEEE